MGVYFNRETPNQWILVFWSISLLPGGFGEVSLFHSTTHMVLIADVGASLLPLPHDVWGDERTLSSGVFRLA